MLLIWPCSCLFGDCLFVCLLVFCRLVGLVVKASASRAADPGSIPACTKNCPGRVIAVTEKLASKWLPCQLCMDCLAQGQWLRRWPAVPGLLFVGCLTSQQQASVSQGRICSDNFTCCHTETEAADQTFYLTQSQYTDTGPTSPSADPITPGAWQGSHWSANI